MEGRRVENQKEGGREVVRKPIVTKVNRQYFTINNVQDTKVNSDQHKELYYKSNHK